MWTIHVEEDFSSAHANGPDGHKCNNMHGHDWLAVVEISYDKVDENGWGPDFGEIKALIRPLDHQNLNELLGFKPSAENIAAWLYKRVEDVLDAADGKYGQCRIEFVRIHEGGANSVTFKRYWQP